MTTFPFGRVKGRPGSGQIEATVYAVPKGTLKFWADQLSRVKARAEAKARTQSNPPAKGKES